jgi:hypothetical protein
MWIIYEITRKEKYKVNNFWVTQYCIETIMPVIASLNNIYWIENT